MPDHGDWSPSIVTLCEKFLAEAKGDVDEAARLMFENLVPGSSDRILEQAIKKAMKDYKSKRRRR